MILIENVHGSSKMLDNPNDHIAVPRGVLLRHQHKAPDKVMTPRPRDHKHLGTTSSTLPSLVVSKTPPRRYPTFRENIRTFGDSHATRRDIGVSDYNNRRISRAHQCWTDVQVDPNRSVNLPAIIRPNYFAATDDYASAEFVRNSQFSRTTFLADVDDHVTNSGSTPRDVTDYRNKRKVEFRSDSPQVISSPRIKARHGKSKRFDKKVAIESLAKTKSTVKSILKRRRSAKMERKELATMNSEQDIDTLKLPNIEKGTHSDSGTLRVDQYPFSWGITPHSINPHISFTCSKDFAKVLENLDYAE